MIDFFDLAATFESCDCLPVLVVVSFPISVMSCDICGSKLEFQQNHSKHRRQYVCFWDHLTMLPRP